MYASKLSAVLAASSWLIIKRHTSRANREGWNLISSTLHDEKLRIIIFNEQLRSASPLAHSTRVSIPPQFAIPNNAVNNKIMDEIPNICILFLAFPSFLFPINRITSKNVISLWWKFDSCPGAIQQKKIFLASFPPPFRFFSQKIFREVGEINWENWPEPEN